MNVMEIMSKDLSQIIDLAKANMKSLAGPVFNVQGYGAKGDGVTDDTAAIQSAINAAIGIKGGIVYFPQGKYKITSLLNINSSNIVLVGSGAGNSHNLGVDDNATVLTWRGAAGGTMISISAIAGSSNQNISRCGIKGIHLDGSVSAGIGLEVKSHNMGIFEDLYLNEFTSKAISLDVVPTLGEWIDTQSNSFTNIFIRNTATSGDGIYLNGLVAGNTSYNYFENIDIVHSAGRGIVFGSCDNNFFEKVRVTRSSGTGLGIEFLNHASNIILAAAANYIVHLTSPSGVTARGGTYPSTNNHIMFYDMGNGSPLPTIETGASLYVQTEENIHYNTAMSGAGFGDGRVTSKHARDNVGTASLRVKNISGNHMVLDDGTNTWAINVNSSGLRLFRLSGAGQVNLFNGLTLDGLQVSYGAADSAGVGFRTMRVPN